MAFLTACSNAPVTVPQTLEQVELPDTPKCQPFMENATGTDGGEVNRKFDTGKFIAALTDEDEDDKKAWNVVDDFLDCVFAPIDDNDVHAENKRQFRAHVIVTLLARYGAFNMSGDIGGVLNIEFRSYPERQEDAATLISHIELAEKKLRAASGTANLPGAGTQDLAHFNVVPTVAKIHRMAAVMQVALDAETPTARRAKGFIRSLISAAASPNLDALKRAAGDAINGLSKTVVLRIFGDAYLADATAILQEMRSRAPTERDWRRWDGLLIEACDRLAAIAGGINHCVPSEAIQRWRNLADT